MTPHDHQGKNQQLVALSRLSRHAKPIVWPRELDRNALYFAPELISIAGTEVFDRLTEDQIRRLSLLEAANFFSLNIHGEQHLIAELGPTLKDPRFLQHRDYLEHFVEEEIRHTAMFKTFCRRSIGKIYPDRNVPLDRDGEDDGPLLTFARIAIFEEIVDTYNRTMARDRRLAPLARAINRTHHLDETRHLSFGRRLLRDLVSARAADWQPEDRQKIARRLEGFADQTWRSLFNPTVYADAGLSDVYALRRHAMASDRAIQRRKWALRGCTRLLGRLDLLDGDPT